MSGKSIRADLGTAIKAQLPAGRYRVVTNVGTVDRLSKPLVQLELSAFRPGPALGNLVSTLTIHTATHLVGATPAAEDAADDIAMEVFAALERIPYLNPTEAEKTIYKDQHLGYDITAEIITTITE